MKRRWILWLIGLGFLFFSFNRLTEIKSLVLVLRSGNWVWLLYAMVTQLIFFVLFSLLYRTSFRLIGIEIRLREMIPVTLGSIFINSFAPSAGLAGMALFIDDGKSRGNSPGQVTAATVITWVLHYGMFILFLCFGLAHLYVIGKLYRFEVFSAALFVALIVLLGYLVYVAMRHRKILEQIVRWFQNSLNGIAQALLMKKPFDEEWAGQYVADFAKAARTLNRTKSKLWRGIALATSLHVVEISTLLSLFLAFYGYVPLGLVITCYSIFILFVVISPTPSGIGVVEGIGALFLISSGIPSGAATVIVLAFRGLTFWLPMLLGFFLLKNVSSFREEYQSIVAGFRRLIFRGSPQVQ